MNAALPDRWLDALSLGQRGVPDFYRKGDAVSGVPHAASMRVALDEIGVSAIHCIQGVPTIAFLAMDNDDRVRVNRVHQDLWNQGLMSLLLVIVGEKLTAYTLTETPIDPERATGRPGKKDDRLLQVFDLLADALVLRDFVSGVESGRLFRDHYPVVLDARRRVDGVLLNNLMESHRLLKANGLDAGASQSLLMQTMFIAYLEDRQIISGDYFRQATGEAEIDGFRSLLRRRNPEMLRRLFLPLFDDFNGDLFHSPCAFGHEPPSCALTPKHLEILDDFVWGEWDMGRKQKRLWSYRFRYVPVELISAVYDRMLAEEPTSKKDDGAYYTPMFLADLVVDQAWEQLSEDQRYSLRALDPACGSGVFLVRLFERLVENRRDHSGRRPSWRNLKSIVQGLHGWDKNPMAARIAVFSLYLALLEQQQPLEIRQLMAEGKLLPVLWGESIRAVDFFAQPGESLFDLVIGNPPWNSRRNKLPEAIAWCQEHGYPIPQQQSSWGFVWKARTHVKANGWLALLLPSMGFLHSDASLLARRRWFRESRIERLINFADMRHVLFDSAKLACLLALFQRDRDDESDYRFDYWCPKADLNLHTRRLLTVSRADQQRVAFSEVLREPEIFKHRFRMGLAESRLHEYLASFRRLGDFVTPYKKAKRAKESVSEHWVMGQGFAAANPERLDDPGYQTRECPIVARIPHLKSSSFSPWVLPRIDGPAWPTSVVHRERFWEGFLGPHILIPQMIRFDGRLRAAYDDQDLSYFHSLQAIKFPVRDQMLAKLVTAVMNSRLIGWFFLHDAGGIGLEIPKLHENEFLLMPMPDPEEMEQPKQAGQAMTRIGDVMDQLLERRDRLLDEDHWPETQRHLDELVYDYFDLNADERAIIDEAYEEAVPAIQPSRRARPGLWFDASEREQAFYLEQLTDSLSAWMKPETRLWARVVGSSTDAAIVRVHMGDSAPEDTVGDWNELIDQLWNKLDRPVSRNVQVISDLRLFDGDDLYLFKPRKRRFWLRATAMNEAAAIAGELLKR